MMYYKAKGTSNEDTCEDKKSDFKADDFLLVLQTEGQASMMVDNPRFICVDATHEVTHYDYYLLSVVVIDRHGSGLVVGWGITSRENSTTWQLTCHNFRLSCREHAAPEVLMSDDSNSAWNGLTLVWGSLKYKLLCHWHFKRNVRARCLAGDSTAAVMNTPMEGNPVISYVYSLYRVMMSTCPDSHNTIQTVNEARLTSINLYKFM